MQIELFRVSLERVDRRLIGACTFDKERRCWVTLPQDLLANVCAAAVQPDTPQQAGVASVADNWQRLSMLLARTVASAPPAPFGPGHMLVNIGSSWWVPDYMRHVRHQQQEVGLLYAPFLHDCIPIMTPEFCSAELVGEFTGWLHEALVTADVVLANSLQTATDIKRVALDLGAPVHEPHVVRLDARMQAQLPADGIALARLTTTVRARYGLSRPFALFVATVEARKNHIFVFKCWKRLIERHGAAAVPDLVCVGKQGWLVESTFNWLKCYNHLGGKVRMIGTVSDVELAALYHNSAFGVYCSFYEGWGLPVTESLCHGRVPVIPNHSSLPEAGGPFAAYYQPESAESFCEQVELLLDPEERARREAVIAARFRPRGWSDVLDQLLAAVRQPSPTRPAGAGGFVVQPGVVYSFCATSAAASEAAGTQPGQRMQYGLGWWNCESWGCWSRLGEAQLLFELPPDLPEHSTIYLALRGGRDEQRMRVQIGREVAREVKLPAGKLIMERLPVHLGANSSVLICLGAPLYSLASHTGGGDPREIGFGIEWLAVVGKDDLASRCEIQARMWLSA